MRNLVAGALRIEVVEPPSPAPIQLVLHGRSEDRNPEQRLGPAFAEALRMAGARGVPLEIHFEQLEFFNSSTITSLLLAIAEASRQQIRIVVVFSAAVRWQRINCEALRAVGRRNSLLEVREV